MILALCYVMSCNLTFLFYYVMLCSVVTLRYVVLCCVMLCYVIIFVSDPRAKAGWVIGAPAVHPCVCSSMVFLQVTMHGSSFIVVNSV
jgi:hypothetical protein